MARDARELAGAWTRYQRHATAAPAPDLARWVEKYWIVSWDYARPYRQKVVPYPNVHLVFRDGGGYVRGVGTGHRIEVLDGVGGLFGVTFRVGAVRAVLDGPVSALTDQLVDAAALFGQDPPARPDVPTVENYLRRGLPERTDPRAELAALAVARIAAEPGITRVDVLADVVGTSVRALQRLFAEYVGVGPKWVIRRYRLHEVTERLAAGTPIDWAGLAADLGYTDQAHLTHDFTGIFGEPPTWYARRY